MTTCPNPTCGAMLQIDTAFCGRCGYCHNRLRGSVNRSKALARQRAHAAEMKRLTIRDMEVAFEGSTR